MTGYTHIYINIIAQIKLQPHLRANGLKRPTHIAGQVFRSAQRHTKNKEK